MARCITGARCPGWEREAQWMGQRALSSEVVVPRASQVLSQPRQWRITPSSSPVIDPCRSSADSKGVFLCRTILRPKRKRNQEFQSLLLPDQHLSSSWTKNRERHFCSHLHPRGSYKAWSSATVVGTRHDRGHNLAADHNRTYRPRCTGHPPGCRQEAAILLAIWAEG